MSTADKLVIVLISAVVFLSGAFVGAGLSHPDTARIEKQIDELRSDVRVLLGRTPPGPHVWKMPRDPYPPRSGCPGA